MSNNRKINLIIIFSLAVWILLAILFAFYDLDISKQIVNQNSVWAAFLEKFGMIPGMMVIFSGIYINYSNISRKSDGWSYFKKVGYFLVNTGMLIYLFYIILNSLIDETFLDEYLQIFFIVFLIFSVAISSETFIILRIIKPVQNIIAIKYARIVVGMALFGYVLCIQVVKTFWGRVRFEELNAAFSQFTPWYLPQGINGYDSFPSGHAAMGWILLSLLILFTNKKPWLKYSVFIIICMWSIVLAFSRVIIGAHFASDVLFGSFFMIFTFLFFLRGMETGQKKECKLFSVVVLSFVLLGTIFFLSNQSNRSLVNSSVPITIVNSN